MRLKVYFYKNNGDYLTKEVIKNAILFLKITCNGRISLMHINFYFIYIYIFENDLKENK